MNKKVLLISENNIKTESVLENNVDVKVLRKVIVDVQEIQLRPILGDVLFQKVVDAVYQTTTVENYVMDADLKTLLQDYITPYLIHAVVVDFITTNNYKLTNKGVLKFNDSNATSASHDDINNITNHYKNKMAAYKDLLIDYMAAKSLLVRDSDTQVASESIGWYIEKSNIDLKDFYYRKVRWYY